ncbi:MAG: helix-turn-helix domain-containing protein [Actinomycetota bacterium]|nr:helix-turn-helix domain-containing protein [Actinomycetota bacterium]
MIAGDLIRRAREQAGLTQADLAARLEVGQSTVARLESPRSNPRVGTLERALAATGNSLEISLSPSTFPGIDVSLIEGSLKVNPAQRLARHGAFYKSISRSTPGFRPRVGS